MDTSKIQPLDSSKTKLARHHESALTFALHKYWLLVEILPMTALVIIIRVIIEQTAKICNNYDGLDFFFGRIFGIYSFTGYFNISDVALVLTGGIFLIGFMLNGVIMDYKEAEKLPGEIAGCLGGLEEILVCVIPIKHKDNPKYTTVSIRTTILEVTNGIFNWLCSHDRQDDDVFEAVGSIATKYTLPMYEAGPPIAVRLNQEVSRLRTLLIRLAVISHSTYLPAGYALVELFVLVAFLLVLLARYANSSVCYAIIIGITIIYGGMLRLLKDVDNPFEYKPITDDAVAHGQSGSTEIDLSCLLDYRRVLKKRIASTLEISDAV